MSVYDLDPLDYFGDFEFDDWSPIVEKHTKTIATEIQTNSSLIDYLQSPKASYIDEHTRSSMISEAINRIEHNRYQYDSLSSVITNFSAFGYGSFNSLENVSQTAVSILSNYSSLESEIDSIVYMISSPLLVMGDIGEFVTTKLSAVYDILSNITTIDILNAFSSLPTEIGKMILDSGFCTDLFTAPKRIVSMVSNIDASISSILISGNTNSLITVLSQLSSLVSVANQAAYTIESTLSSMSGLESAIKNGNYYGIINSSRSGLRFLERPTSYATKYPYNSGYVSESGHMFEVDDTPGSERLNFRHMSGSGVEIHPDGSIVAKSKNDTQLLIDKNGEIYIKGLCNVTVEGNTSVYGKGAVSIDSDTGIYISAPESLIVTDGPTTVTAVDVNIISSGNTTLSSKNSTVVSSSGPVTVASDESISLDAPLINIGSDRTKNISILSNGTISSTSTDKTFIKSFKVVDIKAPLIKLN